MRTLDSTGINHDGINVETDDINDYTVKAVDNNEDIEVVHKYKSFYLV